MHLPRPANLILALLFAFAPLAMFAQNGLGDPASLGFMPDRLSRVDSLIQHYIDNDKLAGAISYISRDGQMAHYQTYGMMDKEAGKPMTKDAIFRIASMSKAVTSVAIMILYEEGHFLLSDPIYNFIPEFRNSVVAVANSDGSGYSTEPVNSPITFRHLLTHTAGLTYGAGPAAETYKEADLQGWYFADRPDSIGTYIRRLATLPLNGQPGEAWQYGYSTDVLGYLVEVVSGMPLDLFFEERIFRPLGMKDSYFFLPTEKADRLASVYGLDNEGVLSLNENNDNTDYLKGPRVCFSGGAGLLSTANDYGRLLQMLLNDGILDDKRILSPKSVELMHANHIGDMYAGGSEGFGLGFAVVENLGAYGKLGSVGSYRWGSAYYPVYWIDPQEKLIGMILTQLMPGGGLPLRDQYPVMVYQALLPNGK